MNDKKFSDAMSEVDSKYVEEAINYKRTKKKPSWMKWGAMAACFVLGLAIGIPMLKNQNDHINLSDASTNVSVRYTNSIPTRASGSGALAEFTEEELFTRFNTAVFKGTVLKIDNIKIDYNGFTEYKAIAEIRVDVLYRGNCKVGDTVSVLLPCPIQADIWVEDTGVAAEMREGTVGIFMPQQYDETFVVKMNGAVLALQDVSDYGLPDGERFAFLETSDGLVFNVWAYQSIANATTLDEVVEYVESMVATYSYEGEPVRGGVTIPDEEHSLIAKQKVRNRHRPIINIP